MHGRPRPLNQPARLRWAMAALALLATAEALGQGEVFRDVFEREVDRRLTLPEAEQARYAAWLESALRRQGLWPLPAQFFVLVDRSPRVQAALVFWQSGAGTFHWIGAAPCSTGKPGRYEYFETPVGVFDHTVANPDFRAEGTRNEQGVRGYGERGMRVFDFGWVAAPRGWGDRHPGQLRLQMHATDPDLLEHRLGTACSKGCIRIPAALNTFLDRHGILDADYEAAHTAGRSPWVLNEAWQPTPWSGRYLVVIDSGRRERPDWARLPRPRPAKRRTP